MIRLSCWIRGVSCVPVDEVLVEDTDQARSAVMQATPVKRCIDADVDAGGGLGLRQFVNIAPRLVRHFHPVNGDGESSLEEIREAWRKCRDKLMLLKANDSSGAYGKAPRDVDAKAPCLSDAD